MEMRHLASEKDEEWGALPTGIVQDHHVLCKVTPKTGLSTMWIGNPELHINRRPVFS